MLPAALTGTAPSRAHSRATQGICCFSLCKRQPGDAPSARNISPALINVECSWQQSAKDAIPRRAQEEFCAFLCRHQRKAAPPWAAAPELLLPVTPFMENTLTSPLQGPADLPPTLGQPGGPAGHGLVKRTFPRGPPTMVSCSWSAPYTPGCIGLTS